MLSKSKNIINMKNICLLILIALSNIAQAQTVVTKDGVSLGKRSRFISLCEKIAKDKLKRDKTYTDATICKCYCDEVLPGINSSQILQALKDKSLTELMLEDEYLIKLEQCAQARAQEEQKRLDTRLNKESVIEECIAKILAERDYLTPAMAESYCECTVSRYIASEFTSIEMDAAQDVDSPMYNEIFAPCLNDILSISDQNLKSQSTEIKGGGKRSIVPLLNNFDKAYKIKLNVAGVSKYFTLDTGASDLIIDHKIEQELWNKGLLTQDNYLRTRVYNLANNENVEAWIVRLDHVTIGDYTVKNVEAAIIEDGALLCGMSFLNNFDNWRIDRKHNCIVLNK